MLKVAKIIGLAVGLIGLLLFGLLGVLSLALDTKYSDMWSECPVSYDLSEQLFMLVVMGWIGIAVQTVYLWAMRGREMPLGSAAVVLSVGLLAVGFVAFATVNLWEALHTQGEMCAVMRARFAGWGLAVTLVYIVLIASSTFGVAISARQKNR
jgi:hypothetical protein